MLYRISVTERGLTGIANIFRSRLSRLDDLLGAGTVPLTEMREENKHMNSHFWSACVVRLARWYLCRLTFASSVCDPPGSPFLPGMVPPGLPTPNDTLMTLWNLYNSRQAAAAASPPPPSRRHEPPPAAPAPAPQSEALNLGVHRDMVR